MTAFRYLRRYDRIHKLTALGGVSSIVFKEKRMAVVGLGNVGSQVAYHLNLLGCPLLLIDNGVVEEVNLGTQGFTAAHLGVPKVEARAAQLTALNPDGKIDVLAADIAVVGPGHLSDCAALVSCLDSWPARAVLHQISWELGIPLIDSGLDGSGVRFYGRVAVYLPHSEHACMFCTWDRETLRQVNQTGPNERVSCSPLTVGGKKEQTNPTLMLSCMGGVVAGVQVIQTLNLVLAKRRSEIGSREVLVDLTDNQLMEVRLERNPDCLFPHANSPIKPLKAKTSELSVKELFRLASKHLGEELQLFLPRRSLALQLRCGKGHVRKRVHHIVETLPEEDAICHCGARLHPVSSDVVQHLTLSNAQPFWNKTWHEVGLPNRDLIRAQNNERAIHYLFC